MSSRAARGPLVSLAVVAALLLAGCSGEGGVPSAAAPPAEESAAPVESATPEPSESAEPTDFVQPKSCDDLLAPARLSDFDARHLELLGGPGNPFYGDRTDAELAGGITCVWGNEVLAGSDIIEVSAAPLDLSSRRDLIDTLTIEQGLNETEQGDALAYGVQGDEQGAPAQVNVLRSTSWISVLSTPGGLTAYTDATAIAAEVAAEVYR
ncbi:hypothetical protein [Salinibacterium sp. ZJ454]|uniref:hypothetical protein n=1 Tax=Salinibacterium sp. ZJ454 TaxID=2708339 RepID=UPI00141F8332|nr:hypothetical protein [Salinibacterium sp. ZJ454]